MNYQVITRQEYDDYKIRGAIGKRLKLWEISHAQSVKKNSKKKKNTCPTRTGISNAKPATKKTR
jgi:hypothetical protein